MFTFLHTLCPSVPFASPPSPPLSARPSLGECGGKRSILLSHYLNAHKKTRSHGTSTLKMLIYIMSFEQQLEFKIQWCSANLNLEYKGGQHMSIAHASHGGNHQKNILAIQYFLHGHCSSLMVFKTTIF